VGRDVLDRCRSLAGDEPETGPRCDVDDGAADRFERTLLLASLSVAVEGRWRPATARAHFHPKLNA
jgi:hypothetical protein